MSIPIIGQSSALSGLRGDVAAAVKTSVKGLMRQVIMDRLYHAEVVAAGPVAFRRGFVKEMGPAFGNARGPCGDLADVVHAFFVGVWRERYPEISASAFLDAVHVPIPETEKEREQAIEDAWEIEIGSSDAAMQQMYEGSARTRKGRDLGAKVH